MSRDDIIRMAREAGSIDSEEVIETVWRAFSVAEREACAQLVTNMVDNGFGVSERIVAAIRARKP